MLKEYEPETLKRVQNAELSILKDFDRVCNQHGIRYFLVAGSLLGAIRHKGFIPWDDDLDIGMTRENYEKFTKIVSKELGDDYILATPEKHSGYCGAVIKLMRRNTKFIPAFSVEMKCDLGIYIDIFVWDNFCDKRIGAWLQVKEARVLSQLIFLCGSSKPEIPYRGILKISMKSICKLMHFVFGKIPNIEKKFYKCFEMVSKRENHRETKYITCFQMQNPYKNICKKQDLIPYLRKPFENFSVSVSNNYEENLILYFGSDYMSLPPKEMRINHCAEIIDFGNIY